MRFVNFQLIAYPELPDDFVEKHESVWVNIDSKLFDPAVGNHLYNQALDLLGEASRLGFDAVGVNEHHNNAYAMTPSPNILAACLARETADDVALVVIGNSLVQYNPPVRVAEEFAMLDVLSGGRLVAGFPVGTPMDGPYCYSINPSELRDRYIEASDLIIKAWTTDEMFEWNGQFNQLRYVNIWPRPMQRPRPPVWIPGAGSVDTFEFCTRNDFLYAYLNTSGYYRAQDIIDGFWATVREENLEPNPFRAGFAVFFAVADTYKEAKELYGPPADYFFNRALKIAPRFGTPPGYMTEATLRKVIASQSTTELKDTWDMSANDFDAFVERGWIVAGDPDSVSEQIAEIGRRTNVGNLVSVTSYGNMSRDLAMYNTRLFAEKVLPNVQPIFENEWEHRWWPKGLPRPATTAIGEAPAEVRR